MRLFSKEKLVIESKLQEQASVSESMGQELRAMIKEVQEKQLGLQLKMG